MLKSILRAGVVTAILFGTGCDALSSLVPGLAGTSVDDAFWKDNMPTFKVGMKWTYTSTVKVPGAPDVTSSYTKEITEANDTRTKVRTTSGSTVTEEVLNSEGMEGMADGGGNLNVTMSDTVAIAGTEDVTIPAGTYKGASKLNVNATSSGGSCTVLIWVAKGVGIVKERVTTGSAAASTSVTIELASFTGA